MRSQKPKVGMPRRAFILNTAGSVLALSSGIQKLVPEMAAQQPKSIVIDCHIHLVRRAFAGLGLTAHYTWHEYGGDLLVAEMDRAGVDKALVKTYSAKDLQYVTGPGLPGVLDTDEDYVVPFIKKYPDRLLWMDVFNPKDDDMGQWRTKIKDPLLRGLAFFITEYYPSGFTLLHEYYSQILELAIAQTKASVLITFEQTPEEERETRLAHWVQLVKRFGRNVRWCLNHGGYWTRRRSRAGELNKVTLIPAVNELNAQYDNIWFETAGERGEYPYSAWQEKVHQLAEEIGFDKVCYGTDWPYSDATSKYFEPFEAVRKHGWWASELEKQWFLGENAARFMSLPEAKPVAFSLKRSTSTFPK